MKAVQSVTHLKELTTGEPTDFLIAINGGLASRKTISHDGHTFFVWNHIDDSEQELTDEQLMDGDFTNIGYAIEQGALYY